MCSWIYVIKEGSNVDEKRKLKYAKVLKRKPEELFS